jgi:hypothetical protein
MSTTIAGDLIIEQGRHPSSSYICAIEATDGAYVVAQSISINLIEGDEDQEDEENEEEENAADPPGFFQAIPGYGVLGGVGAVVVAGIGAAVYCIVKAKAK